MKNPPVDTRVTRSAGAAAAIAAPRHLANRMRRGELMSADCPSRDVLDHVTSRWGVLLLVVLMGGMHRFSELRRQVGGVSEKMLAQTLRSLEGDGLVHRKSLQTVPPHVEYTLTPLGVEAGRLVEALADWIELSMPRIVAARGAGRPGVSALQPSPGGPRPDAATRPPTPARRRDRA